MRYYLKCDGCQHTIDPSGYYTCYYWGDEKRPAILYNKDFHTIQTKLVWCYACNALTFAERLYTPQEWETLITIERNQLNYCPSFNQIDLSDDEHFRDDLRYYSSYEATVLMSYYDFYKNRKNRREACLVCGGYRYHSFIDDNDKTSLVHSDCAEGRLQLKSYWIGFGAGSVRIDYDFRPIYRIIDKEGQFIGFYKANNYSHEYWERYELIPEKDYQPVTQGFGINYRVHII